MAQLPDRIEEPSAPDFVPAARLLAEVERRRGAHRVRLPPRFARAAVERLFSIYRAGGAVLDEREAARLLGRPLGPNEWAIGWRRGVGHPLGLVGAPHLAAGVHVFVYPKHVVELAPRDARYLLRALEEVKPAELDPETGQPYPWVPAKPRIETLGARIADDEDAQLGDRADLPPQPAEEEPDGERILIDGWLTELCRLADLARPELVVARARDHRLGFCAGRIWLDEEHRPLRVRLVLCPNSDHAEILATLVHELAHASARTRTHSAAFKRALIDLAAARFGARYFAGARAHAGGPYRIVDYWIASGIRAALRGAEPPAARSSDDTQLAKILIRIKKLRSLAGDQLGRPEGIAATAAANDLITSYGLESYGVSIEGETLDQLVDAFVPLGSGALWRRTLAHAVAVYCDVFSLAMSSAKRMHYFGRHADVVTAEYLYGVSGARIERECERHVAGWKLARTTPSTSGETRREKTSFCDSAAVAFRRKLEQLKRAEGGDDDAGRLLAGAEGFARDEHAKRGQSWSAGGKRTYRDNAAGRRLGGSMEVVRGVGRHRQDAPRLPHR